MIDKQVANVMREWGLIDPAIMAEFDEELVFLDIRTSGELKYVLGSIIAAYTVNRNEQDEALHTTTVAANVMKEITEELMEGIE